MNASRALVLALFFVSGAAGLVYQVAWARSLGLVFGASHLAIATVLAVYMGGQALGGALIGARAEGASRPLRWYGLLEIGIGLSALGFLFLLHLYPHLYPTLARAGEQHPAYLTLLRTAFALVAMIVPATLMGGTLPVLVHLAVGRDQAMTRELSLLYAFNTFGAVFGTLAAGFVLLRLLGVTTTIFAAAAASAAVGIVALLLDRRSSPATPPGAPEPRDAAEQGAEGAQNFLERMTVFGIAVSGFCALGYEVLWTRMLSLVVGTSVYSFTIMLVAFLSGIGVGSHAFGLRRTNRSPASTVARSVRFFGGTQIAIGASALVVTILMRSLPQAAMWLQELFIRSSSGEFGGRLLASSAVALAYMFVPAFFMGLAFPAAGSALSSGRGIASGLVGRLLAANTIGAILGSILSGFALIPWFGIERSLQILVMVNVLNGLALVAAPAAPRWVLVTIPLLGAIFLFARGAYPDWGRVWDRKFFATYSNNARSLDPPEVLRQKLEQVEILYYFEGINETVSVIRPRGAAQAFIVNGRPEASTKPMDMQLQRTLGHLPVLLHPAPRSVFILGTGSGMTLGAAAAHPEVERLVLAEIEPGALGVARAFGRWNGDVLDDPRLQIVFNDGRNFLATTQEKFDVISADPLHPWSGGAGYLYTREYFRTVSERLAPGGIACQWLPLYELTPRDVRTVVRTFAESFPFSDGLAHLLRRRSHRLPGTHRHRRGGPVPTHGGSGNPRRAGRGQMGTPDDFLSFFAMGTRRARDFAAGGDLNTDDNLVLEFSAPASQGVADLVGRNVRALAAEREGLLPYLAASSSDPRLPGAARALEPTPGGQPDLRRGPRALPRRRPVPRAGGGPRTRQRDRSRACSRSVSCDESSTSSPGASRRWSEAPPSRWLTSAGEILHHRLRGPPDSRPGARPRFLRGRQPPGGPRGTVDRRGV